MNIFLKQKKTRLPKRKCNKTVTTKSLRYKSHLSALTGSRRRNIKIYDSCYELCCWKMENVQRWRFKACMADHGLYCSIIIQLVPYSCITLILIIHNLSRCRLWRGGWEMYTQYHDSSPIQSPTNCIKSHNNTYMYVYVQFSFPCGQI